MPSNKVNSMTAPTSTLLLCFTRFERMRGNNAHFLGAPTANKYLVITMKCGLGSFLWGSALSYGFRTHPMRTHQSALTSSSIRNECWVYIYTCVVHAHINCITHIKLYISATVPIGTPGRVWGNVWLSDDLAACLACFKGPTLRYPGLPGVRCVPVFNTFFFTTIVLKSIEIWVPKITQNLKNL